MSTTVCPACNKPLPAAVVNGPPQAVVRCDGCQTLLLWSNGRVMRSARSSTGTMMGMPAVTVPKKDGEPQLSALKPEAEPAAKPGAPSGGGAAGGAPPRTATQPLGRPAAPKAGVTGLDNVPTRVQSPPPELLRNDPSKPNPASPPAANVPKPIGASPAKPNPTANVPKPVAASPSKPIATGAANVPKPVGPSPSKPIATATPNVPKPVGASPSKPIATTPSATTPSATTPPKPGATPKPMAASPSKPNPLPPPAQAAPLPPPAAPASAAGGPSAGGSATAGADEAGKPSALVAAVAEVPSMSGGPMVDPSVWFSGGSETGDVVLPEKLPAPPVVESSKPARRDNTGAAPLPPPPELPPLKPIDIAAPESDLTPDIGTVMPALRKQDDSSAPIDITARSDKQPDKQPSAPIKVAATTPARKDMTPPPQKPAASPKKTILGIPSPMREPAKAQPVDAGADGDDVEMPIEVAEDDTSVGAPQALAKEPARPVAMPSASPASAAPPAVARPAATTPSVAATPSPTAAANAPTMMAERETSAPVLPAAPSAGEPEPPSLAAGTMEPAPLRGPRFAMPAISRRVLAIGGGAVALLLIIVLAVSLSRSSHRAASAGATAATTPGTTPAPSPPEPPHVAATAPGAATPTAAPPAKAPPAAAPAAATPTGAAEPPPTAAGDPDATPQPPRPRRTLGGKKVVLEYDPKPTAPAPPPPQAVVPMGEDPATVARAREAYHKGNVKLFAGDSQAAISLYREALKIYPGYVAGYRGLGLGYEAAGNPGEALKAFRTYVKTVPNANDSPIVRRRIEHLESLKPSE